MYAWIVILQKGGTLSWTIAEARARRGQHRLHEHRDVDRVLLHLAAVHDRAGVRRARADPDSLLEASGDLGARGWRTLRSVILPLALPGIVAGSIFTFSLTLGDFITPLLVGGANSQFIGNVIYSNLGTANNLPFAATLALVPIVIMIVYLPARARSARSRRCDDRGPL